MIVFSIKMIVYTALASERKVVHSFIAVAFYLAWESANVG